MEVFKNQNVDESFYMKTWIGGNMHLKKNFSCNDVVRHPSSNWQPDSHFNEHGLCFFGYQVQIPTKMMSEIRYPKDPILPLKGLLSSFWGPKHPWELQVKIHPKPLEGPMILMVFGDESHDLNLTVDRKNGHPPPFRFVKARVL